MGVSYLLDTHVLLWWLGSPHRIPAPVHDQLADPGVRVWASAVSAMEIATKTRLGKLADVGLTTSWSRRLVDISVQELTLTSEHALLAGSMSWPHRDPFDRMLVAQAVTEGAVFVSVDEAVRTFPAVRLLSW